MPSRTSTLLLSSLLCLVGCSAHRPIPDDAPTPPARPLVETPPQGPAGNRQLQDVRSWAIQLQGLERDGAIDALVAAKADLLVLETVDTVRGMQQFDTKAMVARVHQSRGETCARKLCIAYLNIGQAEDYRTYWQPHWRAPTATARGAPPFLLAVDPDGWAGNYPVAYWEPAWRKVLFGSNTALLDRILQQGFDGVFLDWVLGHGEPAVVAAATAAGIDAADAMVQLVADLRRHAHARKPGFLFLAQNGIELLEQRPRFATVIDGITQEDLSFRGTGGAGWEDPGGGDIPAAAEGPWSTTQLAARLSAARDRGLPVFTLDYALDPANRDRAFAESRRHGFVPFVSRVALDRLP